MRRHRAPGGVAPLDAPYELAADPRLEEIAAYQRAARDWVVMWSTWRRCWTAIARFGARPLILDHPNPHELLRQCRTAEMAAAARSNLAIPV